MLPGLIDVEKLSGCAYDEKKAGLEDEKSGGSSRAPSRGVSGGGRVRNRQHWRGETAIFGESRKNHYPAAKENRAVGIAAEAAVMARITKKRKPDAPPATPLAALMDEHLNALRVRDYSEHTVKNRRVHIGFFLDWCGERGLAEPTEITRPVLERYQRHLFHYRKNNGEPLSFRSQHTRLVPLRVWFRWMTRQNRILHNPAARSNCRAWAIVFRNTC